MNHTWGHLVDDAKVITSRCRELQILVFGLAQLPEDTDGFNPTWKPFISALQSDSLEEQGKSLRGLINAMTELLGKKMPSCVKFQYNNAATDVRSNLDMCRLNDIIFVHSK